MIQIENIASTALQGDALNTRALAITFLSENPELSSVPRPRTTDTTVLAISAALLELFAQRRNQVAPSWTQAIGGLNTPLFLLRAATKMRYLREMCLAESPEPLRKRGLYAPNNYLSFA